MGGAVLPSLELLLYCMGLAFASFMAGVLSLGFEASDRRRSHLYTYDIKAGFFLIDFIKYILIAFAYWQVRRSYEYSTRVAQQVLIYVLLVAMPISVWLYRFSGPWLSILAQCATFVLAGACSAVLFLKSYLAGAFVIPAIFWHAFLTFAVFYTMRQYTERKKE
jgi:hypothetical protein